VLIYFTFALAFLNMVSMRASRVLLALYALKLGAQPFAIGALAAAFCVLPMLLSWPAGRFSDRFGPRWLLVFGTAGSGIGMLLPYFLPELPALYVAAAMSGLAFTFSSVSLQNVVGLLSKPEHRARNFGNFSVFLAVANFIGPLFAGFSIDYAGHAVACLYLAILPLAPIAMLMIWGNLLPGGTRGAASKLSILDSLAAPGVWRVIVASSVVQSGLDLFQFYMPVYAREVGLSASVIGIVLAAFAAASFIVRLAMPRMVAWMNEERLLTYSLYLAATSLVLVPFIKSAALLLIVSFVFGLGMGCGQPITMMLAFSSSAEGRSGEVLGLRLTACNLTSVLGPLLLGLIGSVFGLFAVFWVNAGMLGAGGILTRPGAINRDNSHR
jgi:MFS family permease